MSELDALDELDKASSRELAGQLVYCPGCLRAVTVTKHGRVPRHKPYIQQAQGWCLASNRWVVHNGIRVG